MVESLGLRALEAGDADAGDAQGKPFGQAQARQHLLGESVADPGEGGMAGRVHGEYSATGGGSLSSAFLPVTANRPVSPSRRR